MDHDEDVECTCGPPADAIVLRRLEIVEFIDPEDDIVYKMDLSHDSAGAELPLADVLELTEWAKAIAISPMIAGIVSDLVLGEEGDED